MKYIAHLSIYHRLEFGIDGNKNCHVLMSCSAPEPWNNLNVYILGRLSVIHAAVNDIMLFQNYKLTSRN